MTETPNRISDELRDAFGEAVCALYNWRVGEKEPRITLARQRLTVGEICKRAMVYSSRTPVGIYDRVLKMFEEFKHSPEAPDECELPRHDYSYATVAKCVLQLYKARKDHYGRKAAQQSK